ELVALPVPLLLALEGRDGEVRQVHLVAAFGVLPSHDLPRGAVLVPPVSHPTHPARKPSRRESAGGRRVSVWLSGPVLVRVRRKPVPGASLRPTEGWEARPPRRCARGHGDRVRGRTGSGAERCAAARER